MLRSVKRGPLIWFLLIAGFCAALGVMIYVSYSAKQPRSRKFSIGEASAMEQVLSASSVRTSKYLIVYFDPSCAHCEAQVKSIGRSRIPDDEVIIFASGTDSVGSGVFLRRFGVMGRSRSFYFFDRGRIFPRELKIYRTPDVFIYDSVRRVAMWTSRFE